MKIKDGFVKREIAGSFIVVPVGDAGKSFNGMITLNESGSFFWDCFLEDSTVETVIKKVTEAYDVTEDKARKDVENFVEMLKTNNIMAD